MRWSSGPLEITRRAKLEGFTAQAKETLQRWQDPESLEILKGTPVNCLLVSWAAGLPQDTEQQKALIPLIETGRRNGLSFVGWVEGSADPEAAIAAGKQAGLAAVAIENYQGKSTFPVVAWGDRAKAPWDSTAQVLPISGSVWPGAQIGMGGGPSASPTGIPWIDSNSWYAQMARARTRAPIWLIFDPPGKQTVNLPERYVLSVIDSEAAGARWVISLDDNLRAGLAGKEPRAMETWKAVTSAVSFFENHKEWRNNQRLGVVGVISDFSGANYDLNGEILNLMARRHLCFRAIWKSRALATPFSGLKALVYADEEAPSKELRQKLLAFAAEGGLLVTGFKWRPEGTPVAGASHMRFELRALGKGRLAVAKEDLADAYLVAQDVHMLLSHSNDLLRLYNPGASGSNYSASPDGKKALLQLVNYAGRNANPVSVWTARRYRTAGLWTLGAAAPAAVKHASVFDGMEFYLPQTGSFAALEFEI